jgi:hypothetical protein
MFLGNCGEKIGENITSRSRWPGPDPNAMTVAEEGNGGGEHPHDMC